MAIISDSLSTCRPTVPPPQPREESRVWMVGPRAQELGQAIARLRARAGLEARDLGGHAGAERIEAALLAV
jgi:hypothetical protein